MGQFIKFIAWTAFGASLGLCLFDFVTSVRGLWIILGRRDDDLISIFMPVIFATLALCFNGLSPYMFRMFMQMKFTQFASTTAGIMWVFFLIYDIVSAFVGMVDVYAPVSLTSVQGVIQPFRQLGGAAGFFVIIMAILLPFGPFMCCMFYELARPNAGSSLGES